MKRVICLWMCLPCGEREVCCEYYGLLITDLKYRSEKGNKNMDVLTPCDFTYIRPVNSMNLFACSEEIARHYGPVQNCYY